MNSRQSSIGKKIKRLLLCVSLTTVLFIGIVTVIGIFTLRNNTARVSGTLGDMAAGDSQSALEEVTIESLLSLAESKASLSDAKLKEMQNAVELIAYAATDIVHNPSDYIEKPVNPPDQKNKGVFTAQITRAQDEDFAFVMNEASLMGNIQKNLMGIAKTSDNIAVSYIGSERGYLIVVDKDSDQKGEFFDPRGRPWYESAKSAGELIWTDVYVDIFGHGLTLTCAKPYYDKDGNVAGVAGLDAFLGDITKIVLGAKIGQTGYAYMINENGQIIISETVVKNSDGNIIREDLLNNANNELAEFVKSIILSTTDYESAKTDSLIGMPSKAVSGVNKEKSGIRRMVIDGKDCFIAYASLEVVPWILITVMDALEAVAPAIESKEHIIVMKNDALKDIDIVIAVIAVSLIVLLSMVILFVIFTSKKFADSLTKPITLLQDGVQRIAGGSLDYNIEIQTGDEIESLGQSVNKMSSDLKEYINDLQKVTADKERIGTELAVATQIQSSMLPCIFPSSPEQSGYDIYASMLPAKEVGGDFYDFFPIGEHKLAVVIADVSGKGIPAALFMVITKTLIKNNAQYGKSPKEIFETVNNLLCENNEAGMFVTAFMGILDIPTGQFCYVNAGHNPPLIKRSGGKEVSDYTTIPKLELSLQGRYEWLPTSPGFVLAGMEGMSYKQEEITLYHDDEIFMYTDGVTEAVNLKNELFGELKLLMTANEYKDHGLKEFVQCVKTELNMFAKGAEQADDITMLIMKITGGMQ